MPYSASKSASRQNRVTSSRAGAPFGPVNAPSKRVARAPVSARRWLVAAALGVFATGCDRLRNAAEQVFDQRTPRERYVAGLEGAGLAGTALVQDWAMVGQRALFEAPVVPSTHVEEGYLPPGEPAAIAFRVPVRRGQALTFEVQLVGDTATTLFVDAWVPSPDSAGVLEPVATADSGRRELVLEPRRDGEIIVRAQPELLRGGRFRASVRTAPTLGFPVQGRGERDIGSRFGAPRDGGRRGHHGIDIFAPRGTPVVAARAGRVSRVQTTPIGGHVVWLRDDRGNSLYYAHLDRQAVTEGMEVTPGDTLGFVGNSGNARTTPPHLHFGVYRRGSGPVDPYWFVHRPRIVVPRLAADTAHLGEWVRNRREGLVLRAAPDARADSVMRLPRHTALRVVSATGAWYRVRLPGGPSGYLQAGLTERASDAVTTRNLSEPAPLLARPVSPAPSAFVVSRLPRGDTVRVLGRAGGYLLVRTAEGAEGWVAQ